MTRGEKILVARHSAYHSIQLTEDESGLRTLRFGDEGARQSVVKAGSPTHLELPYTRVLLVCLAFVEPPRRILIVGLGGGTIPSFLHSQLPETAIEVVELDPAVVEIAKAYCGFHEDARMQVFVEDGRDFIERCDRRYDLIILDSFDAATIPRHLATLEFLQAVRLALAPQGIAVANVWGRASNRLYGSMLLTYRAAFEDVYVLDVPGPGTKVFVALQEERALTREELRRQARMISQQRALPYNLGASISGFRNAAAEQVGGGAILRDQKS